MGTLLENNMAHLVFVNIALPWQQRPVAMAMLIFGLKTSNFHFSRLQYFRKVQICGLCIKEQYGTFSFCPYCVAMATEARCHGNVDFWPKNL